MYKEKRKRLDQPRQANVLLQKKSLFTFIAEGYLTRGARRWSWTILKVEFLLTYNVK
jgi:hypothetical protein